MTSITSGPSATPARWNGLSIADQYKTLEDIKESADLAPATAHATQYALPKISAAATKSYEAMSTPYVRGTGPTGTRWNGMSTADQDRMIARNARASGDTVEKSRAVIESQIRVEDLVAEYTQAQSSPEALKAYEQKRADALGASALAK